MCRRTTAAVLVYVACGLFGIGRAEAKQPTLVLTDTNDFYPLGGFLEMLEDPGAGIGIEKVAGSSYDDLFVRVTERVVNLGYSDSAFWFRLVVTDRSSRGHRWYLMVSNANLHSLDLYVPTASGFEVKQNGVLRPFRVRNVPHQTPTFALDLPRDSPVTLYLKVQSQGSLTIPISVRTASSVSRYTASTSSAVAFVLGALLIMTIYNIFTFISVRELAYLHFALFVVSIGIFILSYLGISYRYLWPEHSRWHLLTVLLSNAAILASAIGFTVSFLGIKRHAPALYWVLMGQLFALLLLMLLSPIVRYRIVVQPTIYLSLTVSISLIVAGVSRLAKGYRPARLYVISVAVAFAGGAVRALVRLGLVPSNPITENSFVYGSILFVLLMSLALADRINLMRRQTDRANRELRRYRNHLEDMVEERSRKLDEAQAELVRNERLAALGELIATISHELRNPMGTVRNCLFTLNEKLATDRRRIIRDNLARAERNIVRCDTIIDELLDYVRTGRQNQLESTLIDDWIGRFLQDSEIPDDVAIVTDLATGARVSLDHRMFRSALENVVQNAVQALQGTDATGKTLYVTTARSDGRTEINVRDQGPGIADEVRRRLFEPLFSTKDFGVGLGLAIVKNVMENHGGGVSISSEPGQGTTVCLWLPSCEDEGQ